MDGVNLQSLVKLISQSSGYISINQSTEELKTEGSTFLGKIVIWVRFKFNHNYKEATQTAKSKIKDLLLADQIYGKNFQKRINELDPQGSIFYKDKPLSARKVYRFINEVQQDVGERINRAQDWVGWYSAKAGTIASQESFDGRTKAMLAEKIKNERSLTAEDVDLKGLSDEVNQAAVHDGRAMVAIRSEMDADEHVDKTLSEVLDRRIVASRLKLQDELNKQLAVSGLADEAKQSIATEIADTTIATMDELKTRVNKEVLKQIGDEFDGLLQQVKSTHGFNEQLMQLPEVKEQLHATLAQQNQDEMLPVAQARKQATQLLNQWILSKQETIAALQSSQFAGMPNLLKKLVLHDPHIGKTQIESIQRDVEQTLEEIYRQRRRDL